MRGISGINRKTKQEAVAPRHGGGGRRRSLAWVGTSIVVAGVSLLIIVGVIVADDIAAEQRAAEHQSRRPVDTGGGPPTVQALPPTASLPIPTATVAAQPSVTSRDVPLLEPVEPTVDSTALAVQPEPAVTTEPAEVPQPSPTPPPDMSHATHITVSAVGIDADILEVDPEYTQLAGQSVVTWPVADYAAGHHSTSADPGEGGNIVLAGHDDARGEVFRGLHDIEVGDEVTMTTPERTYTYVVAEIFVRKYRDVPVEEQILIGQWMAPMPEERLTLITCWPYGVDDHRVIVVAKPVSAGSGG